jgi:hypothetical protein
MLLPKRLLLPRLLSAVDRLLFVLDPQLDPQLATNQPSMLLTKPLCCAAAHCRGPAALCARPAARAALDAHRPRFQALRLAPHQQPLQHYLRPQDVAALA